MSKKYNLIEELESKRRNLRIFITTLRNFLAVKSSKLRSKRDEFHTLKLLVYSRIESNAIKTYPYAKRLFYIYRKQRCLELYISTSQTVYSYRLIRIIFLLVS